MIRPGCRPAVHTTDQPATGRSGQAEDLGRDRRLVEHRVPVQDEPDRAVHVSNCTHNVRTATHVRLRDLDEITAMETYVLVYGAYGHTGRFVVTELHNQADAGPVGAQPREAVHDGPSVPRLARAARGRRRQLITGRCHPRCCAGGELRWPVPGYRRPGGGCRCARRSALPRHHRRASGRPAGVPRSPGPGQARRRRGHPGDGVLRRARRPARYHRSGRLGNHRHDHRCLRPRPVVADPGHRRSTGRRNTAARLVAHRRPPRPCSQPGAALRLGSPPGHCTAGP